MSDCTLCRHYDPRGDRCFVRSQHGSIHAAHLGHSQCAFEPLEPAGVNDATAPQDATKPAAPTQDALTLQYGLTGDPERAFAKAYNAGCGEVVVCGSNWRLTITVNNEPRRVISELRRDLPAVLAELDRCTLPF